MEIFCGASQHFCSHLHMSCPVITLWWSLSSLPRNHRISIYHMWASPSFKKKKTSLPPVRVSGRTVLLNHLMVKQWSVIFSSPPARRPWSLPSHRFVCAFKASESARRFCSCHQFVKQLFCVGVSRRNVNPWMIFLYRGTGLYDCVYMRMGADCCNKATIVLNGIMGNLRAFRGGCVSVCLKADSIYPTLMGVSRDLWVGRGNG